MVQKGDGIEEKMKFDGNPTSHAVLLLRYSKLVMIHGDSIWCLEKVNHRENLHYEGEHGGGGCLTIVRKSIPNTR